MTSLTLELPESILASLQLSPQELPRELCLAAAATWYAAGKVSQEVAAQIAGMNRTDFLLALAKMGRDSFHVDEADLNQELARG